MNNTGKYLLLETRVEPIRQELYIYVFGPRLGWSVAVDKFGKVTKTVPHGRTVTKVDPTLAAGEQKQTQFAHDGATTDVQRTITYPNGKVTVDDITTVYEPWDAVILVGAQTPQGSQSQPKTTPKKKPTPIPTEGSLPVPTPSPTP
jgi:hypothetical protein